MSGKSTNGRREFDKLMKALLPGDVVVVTKLDRLARSSRDLHNILHELPEQGCGFVSLGRELVRHHDAVGRLMLTIMGGIAEFEREADPQALRGRHRSGQGQGRQVRPEAEARARPDQSRSRALCEGRDDGRAGRRLRRQRGDDVAGAAVMQR